MSSIVVPADASKPENVVPICGVGIDLSVHVAAYSIALMLVALNGPPVTCTYAPLYGSDAAPSCAFAIVLAATSTATACDVPVTVTAGWTSSSTGTEPFGAPAGKNVVNMPLISATSPGTSASTAAFVIGQFGFVPP